MNKTMLIGGLGLSTISVFCIWVFNWGYLVIPKWFAYDVYFVYWEIFRKLGSVSIPFLLIGLGLIYQSFQKKRNQNDLS